MAKFLNQRPGAAEQHTSKSLGSSNNSGASISANNISSARSIFNDSSASIEDIMAKQSNEIVNNEQAVNNSDANLIDYKETDASRNFISVVTDMVSPFANIDEDAVNKNFELASGQGMSIEDRTVPFECADYIMSNMAYLFMGLVLDEKFKNAFVEALNIEMEIDKKSEEEVKKIREGMTDKADYKPIGNIVLGITTFVPEIEAHFMDKLTAGFDALDAYAGEFDAAVAELTDAQKDEYGFIFSNWAYLVRAFTHNDAFMGYVITVIEQVKQNLTGN